MIRRAFDYHAPDTIAGAVSVLTQYGRDVTVLGGGTMLVPQLSAGKVQPKAILDLRHMSLDGLRREGDQTLIGAKVSYHVLQTSPLIGRHVPLLKELAQGVTGGPQILHHGTIGGSACFANPASDIPGCLAAVGATMIAMSERGARGIPADEFFKGSFTTALADDELLTEIAVPDTTASRQAYEKFKFCTSSWPIVTAACVIENGSSVAHVGIGGAWPAPVRISLPLDPLPDTTHIKDMLHEKAPAEYWADELAPADYRRKITPAIIAKAIHRAVGHA